MHFNSASAIVIKYGDTIMYNMRISRQIDKKPANDNKCYPFSEASINNVPDIDIFIEPEINKAITDGCKEVLRRSMDRNNTFRYGEQGLLISTLDADSRGRKLPHIHMNFQGEYHQIVTDSKYSEIVAERPVKDLIFIHNHPNNSSFSAADLKSLARGNSLLAAVAIGNRHNLFIVINTTKKSKVVDYINNYMSEFQKRNGVVINKNKRKLIENRAARIILDKPEEFKLDYYKLRRKSQ